MRTCNICNVAKPETEFYRNVSHGLELGRLSRCKLCHAREQLRRRYRKLFRADGGAQLKQLQHKTKHQLSILREILREIETQSGRR